MGREEQDVYTEKLMNMILDLVDDIIIIHDSEHTIVWMNRAGEKAFDLTIDEVIGVKCYELFGNSVSCADCVVKASIGGPSNVSKRRIIPKTGVQCDCSAVPYYENGTLKFVVQHLVPVHPTVPRRRLRPDGARRTRFIRLSSCRGMDPSIADFTYFIIAGAIYFAILAIAGRKRKSEE